MINLITFNGVKLPQSNSFFVFEGRKSHHGKKHLNSLKNISKRMVIHSSAYKLGTPHLVKIHVDKFDDYYKKDEFYLYDNLHDCLCDGVIKYITSGEEIESPYMQLREGDEGLKISCIDGRHRYKALKNMGMKIMPVTMDTSSKILAQKYGLISTDLNA